MCQGRKALLEVVPLAARAPAQRDNRAQKVEKRREICVALTILGKFKEQG
jgi:hypothetical protein